MNTEKVWQGWICAENENEKSHLESLGIKVGKWKPDIYGGEFENCEVPEVSLVKLDPFFLNRYVWGLE